MSSRSLEEVISAGELYCAFQPIYDLEHKRVYAYESLVRSRAPEFNGPLEIIGVAVESGMMGRLGRYLRRMSIEQCSQHPVFLNVHPDEFAEGWLVRPDDSIHIHDHDVYLEVTESVPLSHYTHCHSVLAELRTRGAKIAVDDLGAGYSNLKYIADLAPEVVKLDRELVARLATGSRLHRLVTSIVQLCRDQGARVVAEGIETWDELSAVIDTGATYGQGYYLARPAAEPPSVEWDDLVARGRDET